MALVALTMTFVLFVKGRQTGHHSGPTALPVVVHDRVMVQISGEVAHPGIYEISDKKMTNSVIQMSMPLCAGWTETAGVQLTTRIHTGEELYFTCKPPDNSPSIQIAPMKSSHRLTLGIPLELNLMNESDFELLPGIGPALAQRIIQYRQINGDFGSIDELLLVEGIGEKTLKKLSHYFNTPIKQNKSEQ